MERIERDFGKVEKEALRKYWRLEGMKLAALPSQSR